MSTHSDLAAYNRDDQLILEVEIKKILGASPEWVARFRRNILAHDTTPNAPYFLFALPDRFYLWNNAKNGSEKSEPDYTIDARPLLAPYFEKAGLTADRISGESFELIVAAWLSELIYSGTPVDEIAKSQNWLIESGLYKEIEGGHLEHEVVA